MSMTAAQTKKTANPKKVAVIGSGIGGVSAAYHLAKNGHKVTLLEALGEIGGHTYAIDIDGEQVDLGFMMFGDSNPNIKAWFKDFGITKPDGTTGTRIPMSMSVVSDVETDIQFSSRHPFTSFADVTNKTLWRMLIDIYQFTEDLLEMPVKENKTTAEWEAEGRYSKAFYRHYFLPFVSILWTVPYSDVMSLPASQFLRCLKTHSRSLYIPLWQVILGALGFRVSGPKHLWWYLGSKYKEPFKKAFASFGGEIRCNAPVKSVEKGGKAVVLESGETLKFDHVVLATHGDTTAKLLAWSKYANELNKYRCHTSIMYVHRDPKFLPKMKKQWASWNVRITEEGDYVLTYWMNRIQRLKNSRDVFVTIIPSEYKGNLKPAEDTIIKQFDWDHPRLLADCIPESAIIKEPGITLSGAWLGRGFHEDGFVAGRRAARIVDNPAAVDEILYEDPDNVPVPPVRPHMFPLSLKILFSAVLVGSVAAIAYGVKPELFDFDA